MADLFPKRYIATVNGILTGGIYLGGSLASLSIILDSNIGWRYTLYVVGFTCTLLALSIGAFIPEPRESQPEKENSSTDSFKVSDFVEAAGEVVESKDAKLLLLAAALRYSAGFTIGVWKAPFVFDKFPGSEALFAGSNAAIMAGGGIASSLLGGYISDYIAGKAEKNKARARMWVPAIGSIIAAPLWAGFIMSDDPAIAASYLLVEYLAAECWIGATVVGLYNSVPENRRGTAQGIFSTLTAVGSVAPIVIGGLMAGDIGGAPIPLNSLLVYCVSGAYLLSGVLFTIFATSKEKVKTESL